MKTTEPSGDFETHLTVRPATTGADGWARLASELGLKHTHIELACGQIQSQPMYTGRGTWVSNVTGRRVGRLRSPRTGWTSSG
jgi:hypothetical protein